MPLLFPLSPILFPTALDCSVLLAPEISFSKEDAAAKVTPFKSSIN